MSSRGRAELAQRPHRLLALLDRAGVADDHADHRLPRAGSGTNSSGGAVMNARPVPTSSGASRHEVAVEAHQVAGHRGRVEQHAAEHDRADLVQAEVEGGDHAEVAAAAAQAPEQVGVLVL